MKNLSAVGALALAFAAPSALAADLPSKKAPVAYVAPAPVFTWTGLYAGLNVGYGWSESQSLVGNVTTGGVGLTNWSFPSSTVDGVIGGGQIGYNYQFAGTGFVVGLEADFQGAGLSGSSSGSGSAIGGAGGPFPVVYATQKLDWFGTVRGRLGYAVLPTLLVYGTGGFAYGGYSANYSGGLNTGVFTAFGSDSDTRTGWTAGGGLEWAFLPNWSAKVEYLYTELERGRNVSALVQPNTPFVATQIGVQNHFHTVRVGVNYHFDLFAAAAPVVAKY